MYGQRTINKVDLSKYVPRFTTLILSGDAKGVDSCAKKFAEVNNISFMEFKPNYKKYGISAPIVRNKLIVELADYVIIIWDGKSKGTLSVIKHAIKTHTDFKIYFVD